MIEINQNIEKGFLPADNMSIQEYEAKYGPIREKVVKECQEVGMTKVQIAKQLLNHIPARPVLLEDFPELNMERNKGAKYYYNKLKQDKEEGKSQALKDMLSQAGNGTPMVFDHDLWDEITKNMSEGDKKMLQQQTEHALTEVAEGIQKSRGTIPGELASLIEALQHFEPPKFNWKAYLRRFIGNAVDYNRKSSRIKLNKRFQANPGRKVKRKKHILVGVDTSGLKFG